MMHKITQHIKTTLFISLALLTTFIGHSQETENEFKSRTSFKMSYKPIKDVKISVKPELRFDENFSIDNYLIEGEISYKPFKLLSFHGIYRFIIKPESTETPDYQNRYAFGTTLKKEFNRFEPAFRLRYTNYADDDIDDKVYLRYKASIKYDINNCKITPFIATELFQKVEEGNLHKIRYSTGINYKIIKNNSIGLKYRFDYFLNEYKNNHIISVGYKLKF